MFMPLQLVVLAAGIAFAFGGVWLLTSEASRVHHARTWPRVVGYVLESFWEAGEGSNAGYDVRIKYQYRVAGNSYTGVGHIIAPAESLPMARKRARAIHRGYGVGIEFPIAYNPRRPNQSEIADERHLNVDATQLLVALYALGMAIAGIYTGLHWR